MRKTIAAILGIIILAFMAWLISTLKFISWDFRSNLWATAYLFWHGRPAYDVATLFPGSSALWLPQIIVLFSPLGLLPLYPATALWLITNVGLLIGITWYVSRAAAQHKPTLLLFLLLLLSVILFPPTGSHFILGQADLVIIAAILGGTLAFERDRIALSGFLYALALAKPQLCSIVFPSAIGYVLLAARDRRKAFCLLLGTLLFALTFTLPFWISNPLWVNSYISNYYHNPLYVQPSVFSWLDSRFGPSGLVIWLALFLGAQALCLMLWSRLGPTRGVLWSLALTTIVSPYIWGWDFILLLPLFIDTAARLTHSLARSILFGSLVVCLVLTLESIKARDAGNYVLWWIPFEMLLGILFSLSLDVRARTQAIPGTDNT